MTSHNSMRATLALAVGLHVKDNTESLTYDQSKFELSVRTGGRRNYSHQRRRPSKLIRRLKTTC